jgi:flavin-dependent dehydrogenase
VTGVRALDVDGAAVTLRARLVVGADGLRSVVAPRLGLARTALVAAAHRVRGALPRAGRWARTARCTWRSDGFVGLPTSGDGPHERGDGGARARLAGLGGDRDGFMERWLREQAAARAARGGGRARVGRCGRWGRSRSTPRGAGAGRALVGDAADFFDPFTGEGIYAGLRGGELLAPFAAEAARAHRRPARCTLRGYEAARRQEFRGKWAVSGS